MKQTETIELKVIFERGHSMGKVIIFKKHIISFSPMSYIPSYVREYLKDDEKIEITKIKLTDNQVCYALIGYERLKNKLGLNRYFNAPEFDSNKLKE